MTVRLGKPGGGAEAGLWLVASRCIGGLELPDGRRLVTHVLGRYRVWAGPEVAAIIDAHRMPCWHPMPITDPIVSQLFRALVLRPAGRRETDWIAHAARLAGAMAVPEPAILTTLAPAAPDAGETGSLVLSRNLARVDLGDGVVLITHPLARPTQLAADLWAVAERFAAARVPTAEEAQLAAFLRMRGILWPEGAEGAAASQAALDGAALLDQPAASRYFQFYRPYTSELVAGPKRAVQLLSVGPCLAQAGLEALTHLALGLGIRIDLLAEVMAGEAIAKAAPDLVLYHPAKFTPSLIRAALVDDRVGTEELLRRIPKGVAKEVAAIRSVTDAPVLIPMFTRPRVTPLVAGSRQALWFEELFLSLNRALVELAETDGGIVLIDEDRERDLAGIGRWRDDGFNRAEHNAPVANWATPVLSLAPRLDDPAAYADQVLPPLPAGQIEPQLSLVRPILREIVALVSGPVPKALVIEPNELLWPGVLTPANARETQRQMQVGTPEADFHAGVHEALFALARQGVQIWFRSASDMASLKALLEANAQEPGYLQQGDLAGIVAEDGSEGDPPPAGAVVVDLLGQAAAPDSGVRFPPEWRWRLREYLLTAPEFHAARRDMPRPGERPDVGAPANDPPLPGEVSDALLDRAVATVTGLPLEEVAGAAHFSDIGIDSLGIMQIVAAVERETGIAVPDIATVNRDLFDRVEFLSLFSAGPEEQLE